MSDKPRQPRIGLVLSAGGLRGAAHLGVLKGLDRCGISVDVIVGTSVGAIIGAYYAAVGLTTSRMLRDAAVFRGRHLVAHSLAVRAWPPFRPLIRPWSGVILPRLAQLRAARFDRLHHHVKSFGVVCHDLTHRCPRYLSTTNDGGVGLYDAVVASASIPNLFRPHTFAYEGQPVQCTDGGVSDPLPVEFARQPGLDATHVIISDCRQDATPVEQDERLVYLRPRLERTTTLRAPRATLLEAVAAGEATVTEPVATRIRNW